MKRKTLFVIILSLVVGTVSLNYVVRCLELAQKPHVSTEVPQRIISTSPAITEMLFTLEIEEKIVGATDFCTYPPAAQKLPKIGGIVKPSFEKILSLQPDLVLLGNLVSWMQPELKRVGITTLQLQTYTVEQILSSINLIGTTLNVQTKADEMVSSLKSQILAS